MAKNPEIRRYDPEASAVFRRNQDKWGWLSNFYPCRIEVNGLRTYHSEGLYQAARFPSRPDVQKMVCSQRNPMVSKRTAHDHVGLTRGDWQSTTIRTMRWVLRVKLAQNYEEFGGTLRETGDLSIVEYSVRDGFWGADYDGGQLVGINALGRLLMELRAELVGPDSEQLRTAGAPRVPGLKINGRNVGTIGMMSNDLAEPKKGELPTKVVNIRNTDRFDVYIGRPNRKYGQSGSKYRNPFHIGKDGTRVQVIHLFENWLRDGICMGHYTLEFLAALFGKVLACFCAPLPCHGDVLAYYANWAWTALANRVPAPALPPPMTQAA